MTSKRRLDRIAYLRELSQQGFSKSDAARATGVSLCQISDDAKRFEIEFKLGYKGGRHKNGSRRVPDKIRDGCIAAYGKITAKKTAKRLGISRSAVTGHWHRARLAGLIT